MLAGSFGVRSPDHQVALFCRFLYRALCRWRSFAEPQDIARRCLTVGLFLQSRICGCAVRGPLPDLRTPLDDASQWLCFVDSIEHHAQRRRRIIILARFLTACFAME